MAYGQSPSLMKAELKAIVRGRAVVSEREQKILGIIETARAKCPKFRESRINMVHGAGGKTTQSVIEGCWRRRSPPTHWTSWPTPRSSRRRGARRDHRRLTWSSGCASRGARSAGWQ
jgi:hypothetical protein